ncbi:hypothetical protein MNBD_CHLOROFLEXI01-1195 [hydrothermal vent metagenome]|uniref:Uncharacterized protein n=1 Tax=hydrothermal vent metagenome TaxID=652676 RepID=A0A3B0UZW2_9ZZZZ
MVTLNNNKGGKRPFLQKLLRLFTIGYLFILIMLAIAILRVSPGPESQEVWGVGIGSWQSESDITFLSGRWLNCTPADDSSPFATVCQIEIADKLLQIHASRNEPPSMQLLNGRCEAFYDGKEWPCSIGTPNLATNWFTYIDPPLGLSKAQLDTLRQQYYIENLPEDTFVFGVLITAVLTTLLIVANYLVRFWHKTKVKYLLFLTAVPITLVTFYGSAMIAVWITRGFWD